MKIRTVCQCPPIPTTEYDWACYDESTYDADWDGERFISSCNVGYGPTEEEAIISFVRTLLDDADICLTVIAPSGTIFSTDTNLAPEQVLPPGSPGSIRSL